MKIISVATQKGGEGKTTTASAILYALTQRGYKTLGVDLDPQRNLTKLVSADDKTKSVLGVLTGEIDISDAIQNTEFGDVLPSTQMLAILEASPQSDTLLKTALKSLDGYDYVVIDNPPALGCMTRNSLACADYVVIPVQADIDGLQGLTDLYGSIATARRNGNEGLKVAGILLTRFQGRTNLSKNIKSQLQHIADRLGTVLFNSTIRESVAVKESRYRRVPLLGSEYRREGVCADYNDFIEELIQIVEEV